MVPISMRLLYYLMMDNESLPEKDREAAREMLKVALRLQQDINEANMRRTLLTCLELANDDSIDSSQVTLLSASENETDEKKGL